MKALQGKKKYPVIQYINILLYRLITFSTPERNSDNTLQLTPNLKKFSGVPQFGLDNHLNSNLTGKSPSLFLSKG